MKLLFLLFIVSLPAWSAPDDVVVRAKASAGSIKSQTGSAEALKNNYANPMLSNQQMITTDGTTSFGTQLSCPSSNKTLEVALQPLPTGDVRFLHVLQDVLVNGTLQNVTPSQHVSGVCANGIIQCKPGEWDDCSSFQWTASVSGNLSLEPAPLSDMGGCYCINNSCGSSLSWNNLSSILSDLGGGASAVIAAKNPRFAATETKITDTTISFYGQEPGSCIDPDSTKYTTGTKTPDQLAGYLSNASQLNSDAFTASTSDDLFQGLVTSNLGSTDSYTQKSCDIRRNINIDESAIEDIIGFDGGVGNIRICGGDCLELVLGREGDNYWGGSCSIYEAVTRFYIKKPERIISAKITHAAFDDWIQVRANNNVIWSGPYNNWNGDGRPPGSCELSTNWRTSPNVDFTDYLKTEGRVEFKTRVEVTGGGEGYTRAIIKADTSCHLQPDYITNSCTAMEADPECTLVEEDVDGIVTYSNYASTGLTPLPHTQDIVGAYCSFEAKRDWFKKTRKYQCKGNDDYEFTQGLERSGYIYESATSSEFKDRIRNPETGEYTYTSGTLTSTQPISLLEYAPMCKTRIAREASDVTQYGTVQDKTISSVKYDVFYKECENNRCPVESSSEEIIKACQNINEFAEAATIMQSLRKAGKDIICTSGDLLQP